MESPLDPDLPLRLDPNRPSRYGGVAEEAVEAPSDYKTRYLIVRPYSMALTLAGLTLLIMLRLIPGTVVEQMIGADAIVSPAMAAEFKSFSGLD